MNRKKLRDLTRADLEEIVEFVVIVLWAEDVEDSPYEGKLGWVPDRQWSPDELDMIAVKLKDMGLEPEKPADSKAAVDEYLAWCASKSDPTP